ncbi:MAG: hypothetical protein DYG92_09865 [Leptolyngbya sp. PLA1]|nr:hypothetical protein [Leptolyngbya sp. PLA1]
MKRVRVLAWAGVPLILAGCSYSSPPMFKGVQSATVTAPASPPTLDIETGNGTVTVGPGSGDSVVVVGTVRASTQERLDGVAITTERGADGVIRVRVTWPGGSRQPSEGCSLDVQAPALGGVRCVTSNGSITVSGATGDADLKTSNGAVRAVGCAAGVVVETSNGSIFVEGAQTARAVTSNGKIEVRLAADAPGPVIADSSNGSITLAVGSAFTGKVTCVTSNGSVRNTTGRGGGATSKSTAGFDFGEGKPSSLDTSNGQITVEGLASK